MTMQTGGPDPAALGYTVVSLSVALEETLKTLAEKNGNRAGQWLDELEELALLRARSKLANAGDPDGASAALAVLHEIFRRMRSGYDQAPISA
jgi:hypothetical protein